MGAYFGPGGQHLVSSKLRQPDLCSCGGLILTLLLLFISVARADLSPSGSSSGGLTDTQLRATPVPVLATIDTTGLATSSGQATENTALANIKTDVDKIPSSPAAEHTTAASPNSCRLSDGAAFISTLPVSIASMPSTPVTGTFWQATQPVSLASAPTTPVTGTFWQVTQPVSGTFWQATQPVSIASMPSTPVTGTFWQSTQPVSGSVTANIGTSGSLALDATLTGGTQQTKITDGTNVATVKAASTAAAATDKAVVVAVSPNNSVEVTGTFFQGTQPVSGTFWQSTQPVSGTFWQSTQPVSIASMPTTPVTGTFFQATQPVSLAATVTVSQATTGGNPCLNPASTLVSITGATSGTSAVQIIALSGTTKIYICSMTIIGVSGTSPTFSLVQGTGSNCVTSQTTVVQSWATTAGTLYAFANPVAVGVAGNELCYKDGGTSPVQNYQINYVQQ